jgi:large subunit ribosomal protein L10
MPSQRNIHQLAEIVRLLQSSKATILTEYAGLTVTEQNELRKLATDSDANFLVTKNNILRLALQQTGQTNLVDALSPSLQGPTAVLFAQTDPISGAKTIVKFADDHESLVIKQAIVDGKVLDKSEVTALSKLPGRLELLSSLLAQLCAPAQALVRQLNAPIQNLVYALDAIKNKS